MSSSKIDFAFLKHRSEQLTKFKLVIKNLPAELVIFIWKSAIVENVKLDEMIPLVKQGSSFNKLIFELIQENKLIFDLDNHQQVLVTVDHIPGYIREGSELIEQFQKMMGKYSLKFPEANCSDAVYTELQLSPNIPTSNIMRDGMPELVCHSCEANIDLLHPEVDLKLWNMLRWSRIVRKACLVVNALNNSEISVFTTYLPSLVYMTNLKLKFKSAIGNNRSLDRLLKTVGTLKSLKNLELVTTVSMSELGGVDAAKIFKEFINKHKTNFITKFHYDAMLLTNGAAQTAISVVRPIREFVTGMEVDVQLSRPMDFSFLKRYTELEELSIITTGIKGSNDPQTVRRMKSLNGLPLSFPKLKTLHLHGLAISPALFQSFPDTLSSLTVKDCIPADPTAKRSDTYKFPTSLQFYRFESSNDFLYHYPIIENTEKLACLHTVEINANMTNDFLFDGAKRKKELPVLFLKSLPDTVKTFLLYTESDPRAFNWGEVTFAPLKKIRNLTIEFEYYIRKNCVISEFNLAGIPSNLTYLRLNFIVEQYIGKLNTPELRELYLDLGDVAGNIIKCINQVISDATKLRKLNLLITGRKFSNKTLDLRLFKFGQLNELDLILFDVDFALVTIKIPDLPITFTNLQLDFVDSEFEPMAFFAFSQKAVHVDHKVKIVAPKLSASVKNCRISTTKKEPISLVEG
ncbi:unnamed protein product [Ambrosiozyma monospora]|uniref:Unnamed protein product n=1 Tax=Ambrosiozyma monospora TaxID=43982 RepID=A0A9W7DCD3_AMBMO|nr:unnamed protein product [Ambrosiozyma monospora]